MLWILLYHKFPLIKAFFVRKFRRFFVFLFTNAKNPRPYPFSSRLFIPKFPEKIFLLPPIFRLFRKKMLLSYHFLEFFLTLPDFATKQALWYNRRDDDFISI